MKKKCPRCRAGFTLIELLIVIAIISVLMAILLPTFGKLIVKARAHRTQETVHQLSSCWTILMQDTMKMPTNTTMAFPMTSNNCAIVRDYYDFDRIANSYGILSDWGILKAKKNSAFFSGGKETVFHLYTKMHPSGKVDAPTTPSTNVAKRVITWAALNPKETDSTPAKPEIISW